MKYFIDTEFEPATSTLLSIAVVCGEARFYLETLEPIKNESIFPTLFVRDHVLPNLYVRNKISQRRSDKYFSNIITDNLLQSNDEIRRRLCEFVSNDPDPEFYAWYGATDWHLIIQLFNGQFFNMPKNWPHFYIDLRYLAHLTGIPKEQFDQDVPKPEDQHFALADALWNKQVYNYLMQHKHLMNWI